MKFNEFFGINLAYDDIKSDQKTKLYILFRQQIFKNIFLGLRHRISNINKNELMKNCSENH